MRALLNSTNLHEVIYHPSLQMMEVHFHSGHTYRYMGVPTRVFNELINAPSAGRYYNHKIRGHFSSVRWF